MIKTTINSNILCALSETAVITDCILKTDVELTDCRHLGFSETRNKRRLTIATLIITSQ